MGGIVSIGGWIPSRDPKMLKILDVNKRKPKPASGDAPHLWRPAGGGAKSGLGLLLSISIRIFVMLGSPMSIHLPMEMMPPYFYSVLYSSSQRLAQ